MPARKVLIPINVAAPGTLARVNATLIDWVIAEFLQPHDHVVLLTVLAPTTGHFHHVSDRVTQSAIHAVEKAVAQSSPSSWTSLPFFSVPSAEQAQCAQSDTARRVLAGFAQRIEHCLKNDGGGDSCGQVTWCVRSCRHVSGGIAAELVDMIHNQLRPDVVVLPASHTRQKASEHRWLPSGLLGGEDVTEAVCHSCSSAPDSTLAVCVVPISSEGELIQNPTQL